MMNLHCTKPLSGRTRVLLLAVFLMATIFLIPFISAPVAQAQEKFDRVIEVGVKPGQMKYDVEEFSVPAGGRIKLVFDNSDGTLQHNLLILAPGDEDFAIELAQKAWSMQNPIQNDYVPDTEDVLFATSLLRPGEKETITFTAPEKPGDHPYVCTMPGHAMSMNGMMHVEGSGASDSDSSAGEDTSEASDGSETKEEQIGKVSLSNLSYRYYEGKWDRLPDFNELEAKKAGTVPGNKLTLEPRNRDENFAMVFEGTIHVPETGAYRIFQRSDDGSRLLINGKTVLDHDGLHGATLAMKTAELEKGTHDYRVEYFQKPADYALAQAMVGPGGTRYVLSDSNLGDSLDHLLSPENEALVVRALLPDVPTRSIAVGLPEGGPHYVFDTVHGVVRYAWTGGFLNVGPLRGDGQGRGGGTVNVVGERFNVGFTDEQPIRFGDPENVPDVEFNGYEIDGDAPVLLFSLDGRPVRLTVTPLEEARGLRLIYEFANTPERPVFFRINKEAVNVTSRSGNWLNDGTLKIRKTKKFVIMIQNG